MANTFPDATAYTPANGIRGQGRFYETVLLTNDPTTSAKLNKKGFAFGSVVNESGGSLTISYYGSHKSGGTNLIAIDQDSVAASHVVADDRIAEVPSSCAGMPYLVPVIASGTATVSYHFER